MVTVVIALKPECITMTTTNKASYSYRNLGIPPINMNLAEGNISIICETQHPNNEGEMYLVFHIVPSKSGIDVTRLVAVQ